MRHPLVVLLAAVSGGCAISTPYRETGVATAPTVVVSATHIRLHPGTRPRFQQGVDGILASLEGQPGLVGYSVRRHLWREEYWTFTVWRDLAARDAFLAASAHRRAISLAADTLAWERYDSFEMAAADAPPKWAEVAARVADRAE